MVVVNFDPLVRFLNPLLLSLPEHDDKAGQYQEHIMDIVLYNGNILKKYSITVVCFCDVVYAFPLGMCKLVDKLTFMFSETLI